MKQSLHKRIDALEHGTSDDTPSVIIFVPAGLDESTITGMHSRTTSIQRQPGEPLDTLHARAEAATTERVACWGYDYAEATT